MSDEEILSRCPLFEGMDEDELDMMLGCLGTRTSFYKKNDVILSEGEPARRVGVVLSGRVELVRSDYQGNRSIQASLGTGQLFGEAFACAQVEALPLSVVAAEDSRVMLMDIGRMMTTCSHACAFHRQMVFNLLKTVARKSLALHRRRKSLATVPPGIRCSPISQPWLKIRADPALPFPLTGRDWLIIWRWTAAACQRNWES